MLFPRLPIKLYIMSIVKSIDYSGDQVIITTQNGEYKADKVIISVPLKILTGRGYWFFTHFTKGKNGCD